MPSTRKRRSRKPILYALVAILIGASGVAMFHPAVQARYYANRYQNQTGAERQTTVRTLLGLGEPGQLRLAGFLKSADDSAADDLLIPEMFSQEQLLSNFAEFTPAAQCCCLSKLAKQDPRAEIGKFRPLALEGIRSEVEEVRIAALELARQARWNLQSELMPCLHDSRAKVRAAALVAIGTLGDAAPVNDETLFSWLNDADENVKALCEGVLQTRGRTDDEIQMGHRLTSPDASERFKLLQDLARDRTRDISPWLERLASDREPALRAAAVRLAAEVGLPFAGWPQRLAQFDPDATVRMIAQYHARQTSSGIRSVGYQP